MNSEIQHFAPHRVKEGRWLVVSFLTSPNKDNEGSPVSTKPLVLQRSSDLVQLLHRPSDFAFDMF